MVNDEHASWQKQTWLRRDDGQKSDATRCAPSSSSHRCQHWSKEVIGEPSACETPVFAPPEHQPTLTKVQYARGMLEHRADW